VAVLLNCGESAEQLLAQFEGTARAAQAPERGRMDLRTYGVGAQILRECGVHRMQLMGNPAPHAQHGRLRPRNRGYIPLTRHNTRNTTCLAQTREQRRPLDGKKLHIGIVQARFNEGITNALAAACKAELAALGVEDKNITHVQVPGALEVPWRCRPWPRKRQVTTR
jgi:hypothetical protein